MWRRVLSQSPETVPTDKARDPRTRLYLDGWKALGALLHSGRSLSGRERNCCFLNTGGSRFADISSAVGFDHDSDSRALAPVDWDADGDLDLWLANRTSPRVRYLRNDTQNKNAFLAVRLQGTTCNRDAIGARIELYVGRPPKTKLIQTVSAGEGFVSQASKWLHFGLGAAAEVERLVVHWPGGDSEVIQGLRAKHRYEITQGRQSAVLVETARSTRLVPSAPTVPTTTDAARIVLSRRLPLPRLKFRTFDGQQKYLDEYGNRPLLLNLWASWCTPCLAELKEWNRHAEQIEQSGLSIFGLNVERMHEAMSPATEIERRWAELDLPFESGIIDAVTFETLEVVERVLLLNQSPLPIPTSFLLDADGRLAVVYKGPVSVEQLVLDVDALDRIAEDVRDASVPLRGKWYTDPPPPDILAIASQFVGVRRGTDAYDYLSRFAMKDGPVDAADAWQEFGVTARKVAQVFNNTAALLIQEGKANEAVRALRAALKYAPSSWETHAQLASVLIRQGRSYEAIEQSKEMLRLRRNHPLPWNNIAWVRATSKDPQVRDINEAIRLAEQVCKATRRQEPTALDTLAVAYAAAGRFQDAIAIAQSAIDVAASQGREDVANRIRGRLQLYEAGQQLGPSLENTP